MRTMAYRYYITDALFYYYGERKIMASRYSEIINRKVDKRTGDEIAADVIENAGLKFR